MAAARILIVEDEVDFAGALAEFLDDLGHDVDVAGTGWELDLLLGKGPVDLVILDVNLPGELGLDILRRLRARSDAATIVLTANRGAIERVLGLESGADDYLEKPVELRGLAARVAGLLTRRGSRRRSVVLLEEVTVDLAAARALGLDGRSLRLSAGEVALLRVFAANPGRLLSRDALLEAAPAEDREAGDRAIDSRIARLRRKLATASIATVTGKGYIFTPPR